MLFNSKLFILGFLPLALGGFLALGRWRQASLWWLLGCSLFFYGWWKPEMLALLLASIGVNYALAGRPAWLVAGLAFDLGLLGWFKYAGMFGVSGVILPLGISFFTFQQIMFLVDSHKGAVKRPPFLDYACFVAFFPHLIAGPIVRPGHILPQLAMLAPRRDVRARLVEGSEIFLLGLAKKIVLADGLARFADPGFAAAGRGDAISLIEAWVALLAYGLQIYFDFSGYSDMAIGLARMFGISFPVNFRSPYQARDISDFWRRWNITLSGFLRDYLYIPLGGNRHGEGKRIRNLMITMLLGGLWHGAAWRFVLWGGLHGLFLIVHGWSKKVGLKVPRGIAWGLTLLAVMLAWVPFRARSFGAAMEMYRGLSGLNGLAVPAMLAKIIPFGHVVPVLPFLGDARSMSLPQGVLLLALGWSIALCLPDLQSMGQKRRSLALVASFAFSMQALFFAPAAIPFLYFQF
ncbi:MBOAT family O-acyltransferase [Acidocella sp.]|uniref:MBOAT family O-acyltransferase n=1 Tax=Acidocella sp. TaxID=50710 RepID=UPI003D0666C9